jgi:formate hydrogenlyase subunit 3/multisubunit Na+/H+ antiporter MnhD subunit
MSAPLILTIGTAILALAIGLLRERRGTATAVAAGGSVLLAMFILLIPINEAFSIGSISVRIEGAWSFLGRSFVIEEQNRTAVGFLYLIGAFMLGGNRAAGGGYYLPSVGLLTMNVVAASLMIRPFLFAAIFVEMAAMGGVLILVAGKYAAFRGALRLLALYTLGMMVLLWAGWMIGTGEITSGAPEQAQRATVYLGLGFAILLGIPPFHIWLPSAGEESNPYGLTFVAILLQSAGLFFLLHLLNQYSWLRSSEFLLRSMRIAGGVMVLYGGIMAIAQRRVTKMLAYTLLSDYGIILLAVGSGSAVGYQLAIGHSGARVVSFSLWALGAAVLMNLEGSDDGGKLEGGIWRYPYVAGATLIGIFAAGGFPLTAGFPGRWALLTLLAPVSGLAALVVLVGTAAIGLGGLRWLIIMVRSREITRRRLRWQERLLFIGGMALCLALGIFPQLTYPVVVQAAAGLVNLVP